MRKSPVSYLTDEQYSALSTPERALHQARSHVGEMETGGNNRGPFFDRLLAWLGLAPGNPYCATFVSKCLVDAGYPKSALPSGPAAVRNWVKEAKKLGCVSEIGQRGDLIFRLQANGKGHIGFITGIGAKWYSTIEGNTDSGGSRDGDGVYARRRPVSPPWKAINMRKFLARKGIP